MQFSMVEYDLTYCHALLTTVFLLFKVFNFYMGVQWEAENYETADDI